MTADSSLTTRLDDLEARAVLLQAVVDAAWMTNRACRSTNVRSIRLNGERCGQCPPCKLNGALAALPA
jgi:hypothetical protein